MGGRIVMSPRDFGPDNFIFAIHLAVFSRWGWENAFDDVEKHSQVSCQFHQRWKFHPNQYLALNGRDPGFAYRLVFLSVSFSSCSISQWRVGQP
jgi:hypothetical protein